MKMKKIDDGDIKVLMQEIRALAKVRKKIEREQKNRDNTSIVSSKDVLFYFLAQVAELDRRMTEVETKQKMYCWFIVVIISLFSLLVGVLKLV